jgi:hypothetical protein
MLPFQWLNAFSSVFRAPMPPEMRIARLPCRRHWLIQRNPS